MLSSSNFWSLYILVILVNRLTSAVYNICVSSLQIPPVKDRREFKVCFRMSYELWAGHCESTNRSLPVLNGSLILWWALHTANLLKARADCTATLRLFWFSSSAWKTIKLTARWEWPVESYSLLSFAWEETKIQWLKTQNAGRQYPEWDGMEDHKDIWVSFL